MPGRLRRVRRHRLPCGAHPGVAFGIGGTLPPWIVLTVTGLLCGGIAWAGWVGWLQPPLAAGLIVGGAVGNLLDRMFGGSVIDMIHLTWWPTFNLADVAICTGVVLVVIGALRPVDALSAPSDVSSSGADLPS